MTLTDAFSKHNIDEFAVCDATAFNDATGKNYKECIVALFPYYCGYIEDSNISIYAHGKDYHIVIKEILLGVAADLELEDFDIHSDIGPEIERQLATQAGLCFVGKNGMCINSKYGSYFFIGYIACNADFEISQRDIGSCINCGKCIDACPGKALGDRFIPDRCLSAITQKKGNLTSWEESLIKENGYVFGCDICQRVCPHNENAQKTPIDSFVKNRVTTLCLEDIQSLTNKEFRAKYGDRAFSWRGKAVLERNLKILKEK